LSLQIYTILEKAGGMSIQIYFNELVACKEIDGPVPTEEILSYKINASPTAGVMT
jgi:hypothetical protein